MMITWSEWMVQSINGAQSSSSAFFRVELLAHRTRLVLNSANYLLTLRRYRYHLHWQKYFMYIGDRIQVCIISFREGKHCHYSYYSFFILSVTRFFIENHFTTKSRLRAKKLRNKRATLLDPKKLFYCETENRLLFFKFCRNITGKGKKLRNR